VTCTSHSCEFIQAPASCVVAMGNARGTFWCKVMCERHASQFKQLALDNPNLVCRIYRRIK
jgi:hypothetical protein